MSKIKPAKRSLTDRILTFCASGRFGVREAIAAATTSENKIKQRLAKEQELPKI